MLSLKPMKFSLVLKNCRALETKAYSFAKKWVGAKKRNKRINISEKNKKFFLLRESVKFDVKVIIVHYIKIVATLFSITIFSWQFFIINW